MSPVFCEQRGKSAKGRPSDRLPFLLVRFLWANKENEEFDSFFCMSFFQHTKLLMIDSLPLYPEGSNPSGCKNEPKRAPDCTGPSGCLKFIPPCGVLLAVDGTLKTRHLRRLKQIQRLIPPTTAMLSGTERA